MPNMSSPPELIVRWEQLLGEILDRTINFPKSVRFTFSGRIDNAALDILEHLIDARFAAGAQATRVHLKEADSKLTRLRVLIRLSHQRRYLAGGAYEQLSEQLDEVGRMLGGWQAS